MKGWFALTKPGLFICGAAACAAMMIGGCKSSSTGGGGSNTLSAPTPASPTNGSTNQTSSPTLTWGAVTGATAYDVRVSTTASFASVFSSQTALTALSVSVSGLANSTTYYWEVSAANGSETSAWSGAWSFTTIPTGTTVMGMVHIAGGTFQMGSNNTALYATPVHSVTVSSFYMDTTDVTQASYQALMGMNPSYFDTGVTAPRRPVEDVNWYGAALYCNARSKHDGYDTVYSYSSKYAGSGYDTLAGVVIDYTKHGYRLPTEAEWEYACRAGSTTDYYWGQSYPPQTTADTAQISAHAWWYYNSGYCTHAVATKPANAFGLYDMSGNVWQWCNDWFESYSSGSQTDPTGPSTGSYRVVRGASWYDYRDYLCAASRPYYAYPYFRGYDLGFRCVRR